MEYSGELEFSSPFMEQWTLDARGVLLPKKVVEFLGLNFVRRGRCSQKPQDSPVRPKVNVSWSVENDVCPEELPKK